MYELFVKEYAEVKDEVERKEQDIKGKSNRLISKG